MKSRLYLILIFSCVFFCSNSFGQVFQSPYKDGRPVPDSLKDFSAPRKISLLTNESSKKSEVNKQTTFGEQQNAQVAPEPVFLNPSRKNSMVKNK